MSGMVESTETTSRPSIRDETDDMLRALDTSISELEQKIESGRIADPEKDRVRIKYHRALANAIKARNTILSRREREEMAERLDKIEQRRR